jgi:hypothetical protein
MLGKAALHINSIIHHALWRPDAKHFYYTSRISLVPPRNGAVDDPEVVRINIARFGFSNCKKYKQLSLI